MAGNRRRMTSCSIAPCRGSRKSACGLRKPPG